MAKLIEGVNDLQTIYPDLVKEWDFTKNTLKPTEISAGNGNKVWWLCKEGHSWQAKVANRTHLNRGCPYCSGKRVLTGVTDLATTYPELIKEWDFDKNILKPTEVSKSNLKKVFWLCPKGHSYQSSIHSRTNMKSGCPYCAGNKVLKGYNDLVTTNPDLINEWDFTKNSIKPTEITSGSDNKVYWLCKNGHSYQARIANRTKKGNDCPYCAGRKALKGYNDLQTTHPDIANEWDFNKNTVRPTEIVTYSNKRVFWLCNKGHSFEQRVVDRTKKGNGCPYCSGKRVLTGVTDLATTHPDLAKEWDFNKNTIRPTEISKGCDKKVWWLCEKGHSWKVSPNSRTSSDTGCPYCVNKKVLVGFNDLATINPDLAKEWDFNKNILKPTEVVAKSNKKVFWLCKEGHSWQAIIASRANGIGCPCCNSSISEKLTADVLTELNINFEGEWGQKIGINNRRYDFYLSDLKLCIEIDGQQHFDEITHGKFKGKYANQKRADTQKNNHLLKLGIPLLRIPGLDIFNVRLQEINQSQLDENQFKLLLTDLIKQFISTRRIPDSILNIYKDDSETNYYQVALKMNELL